MEKDFKKEIKFLKVIRSLPKRKTINSKKPGSLKPQMLFSAMVKEASHA